MTAALREWYRRLEPPIGTGRIANADQLRCADESSRELRPLAPWGSGCEFSARAVHAFPGRQTLFFLLHQAEELLEWLAPKPAERILDLRCHTRREDHASTRELNRKGVSRNAWMA